MGRSAPPLRPKENAALCAAFCVWYDRTRDRRPVGAASGLLRGYKGGHALARIADPRGKRLRIVIARDRRVAPDAARAHTRKRHRIKCLAEGEQRPTIARGGGALQKGSRADDVALSERHKSL